MKYLKIFNVAKHPPTPWGGGGGGMGKKVLSLKSIYICKNKLVYQKLSL